ncbi:hypothetical protein [Amycolatopsis sp. NPDC059657]|uniref:hypothetical protein n=1 Tax=Amycolatopsis sp. NPDC059657 TaxID=3346899 RepID=UPI00367183D1
MLAMLRRHYLPESKPPGGIFAAEIQAPKSTRRADLIWQGVTSTSGHALVGHEIKVSRADVLAELSDPTKADAWMKYCNFWYLVIPSLDLVEGLDLPGTWGVLLPPSGRRTRSMTVAVKAPKLDPTDQGPALRTIATWLHWRVNTAEIKMRSAMSEAEKWQQQVAELRLQVPVSERRGPTPDQLVLQRIVAALGVQHSHASGSVDVQLGDWKHPIEVDDVVAVLKDIGAARAIKDKLEFEARVDLDTLKRVLADLDRTIRTFGGAA